MKAAAVVAVVLVVLVAWTDRNDMDSSLGAVNPCTGFGNPSCLGPGYTESEARAGANKRERSQHRYDLRAWLYAGGLLLIAALYFGLRLRSHPTARDELAKEARIAAIVWLAVIVLALGAQRLAEGDSVQIPTFQAILPGMILLVAGTVPGLLRSPRSPQAETAA